MNSDQSNRLVGIFLLALILFNYPIVQLWDGHLLWGSFPVIYLYFFIAWLALIIATFLLIEVPRHKP